MAKRVFLLILDSFGIGFAPDAGDFGDRGANTLKSCFDSGKLDVPHMAQMGLFNIDGVDYAPPAAAPSGTYARLREASAGKDTTVGHWEIAGLISHQPMPTYPQGFPEEVLAPFRQATGRGVLCNKPYSGTQLLLDYGQAHERTGDLLVYTSADSVFQIAAHEDVVPVSELYRCCEAAREILQGKHGVGRVIARPFVGKYPNYTRTANRHDYSLEPGGNTILDALSAAGLETRGVGKIYDIFAGKGLTSTVRTSSNMDGMDKTIAMAEEDFRGLCFVNLVDFDMVYGHRNNVLGYTQALNDFDRRLGELLEKMGPEDVVMITADHGCDPGFASSTDHSREYVPWLVWGKGISAGKNLGTRPTFADVGKTAAALLGVDADCHGDVCL